MTETVYIGITLTTKELKKLDKFRFGILGTPTRQAIIREALKEFLKKKMRK